MNALIKSVIFSGHYSKENGTKSVLTPILSSGKWTFMCTTRV